MIGGEIEKEKGVNRWVWNCFFNSFLLVLFFGINFRYLGDCGRWKCLYIFFVWF